MTTTTTTSHGAPNAPLADISNDSSPSKEDQTAILASVISLATLFRTTVEALTLIHPTSSTTAQKLALTRLGLQQGRLLIFGDVVGISSPPATIATHFVPTHAGLTNPDPTAPIHFNARDPRLDEEETRKAVEACLEEIVGRPERLGREEMMGVYGLKPPKKFGGGVAAVGEQPVDVNRLEGFREKYELLQDLSHKRARIQMPRRGMSMTHQHWTVKDVDKFNAFITMVKEQIDTLIDRMGVQEQVERGMKIDIKSLGWHPDLSGPLMRKDWEKLNLIREACAGEYPQFVQATETALRYINQELRGNAKLPPLTFTTPSTGEEKPKKAEAKRPGLWSRLKSGNKTAQKNKGHGRAQSVSEKTGTDETPRSLSHDMQKESMDDLEPVRSKSMSAMPGKSPINIDSVLVNTMSNESRSSTIPDLEDNSLKTNELMHADTAHSLVDRHDMWHGPGRIRTKDIRWAAKNAEH